MANGFSVAAACGRRDIMEKFKPTGDVSFGGTYNRNPISMTATLATIQELEGGRIHHHLFNLGQTLRSKLKEVIRDLELKAQVLGFGSILPILFTDKEIHDYRDAQTSNKKAFTKFQQEMMKRGVFIFPQSNKRCHISSAHTSKDISYTVQAAGEVLEKIGSIQ